MMFLSQRLRQMPALRQELSYSVRSAMSLVPLLHLGLKDIDRIKNYLEEMPKNERKKLLDPKLKGPGNRRFYDDGLSTILPDCCVSGILEPEVNINVSPQGEVQLEYQVEKNSIGKIADKSGNSSDTNPNKIPPNLLNDLIWVYKTAREIYEIVLDHQKEYIRSYDSTDLKKLKPLTREDVGYKLNINNSTICRLVRDRSVKMPDQTIMPLSSFFVTQKDINRFAVYEVIGRMIKEGTYPETDTIATAMLEEETGICLARRTISKYRSILEERMRKRSLPRQTKYELDSEEKSE